MAAEKETNKEPKTYTEAEVKKMLDKQQKEFEKSLDEKIAAMVAEKMANQQPQILQVKNDDYVTLLFLGVIADNTVVSLGGLGTINRGGGSIKVPKETFFQKLEYNTEQLLNSRALVVIDGLTDEERERFNVLYKKNELLTEHMYGKLLDYPQERIVEIYKDLCDEHKRIVATMFITEYEKGSNRIYLDTVKKLNKISKKVDKDGLFTPIITDLTRKMGEDDDDE